MSGAVPGSIAVPAKSRARPRRAPRAAPMLCEATRPLAEKLGGRESMLEAPWPESARHWRNVTREPF